MSVPQRDWRLVLDLGGGRRSQCLRITEREADMLRTMLKGTTDHVEWTFDGKIHHEYTLQSGTVYHFWKSDMRSDIW